MVTEHLSVANARNVQFGKYSAISKVLYALIFDGYLPAYFFPSSTINEKPNSCFAGICVVPFSPIASDNPGLFQLGNVYAVVPLCSPPELKATSPFTRVSNVPCYEVDCVYPLDMLPYIYGPVITEALSHKPLITTYSMSDTDNVHLQTSKIVSEIFDCGNSQGYLLSDECDPLSFWTRFAESCGFDEKTAFEIKEDLAATVQYQTYQLRHPKPLPSLQSSSVEWEQSLIEGLPLFPLSKYPSLLPPHLQYLTPEHYANAFEQPKVRLVAVPRDSMNIYGDLEELIAPLVQAILKEKAEDFKKQYTGHFLMPVHHMQVHNIQESIPDAVILPEEYFVHGYGLSSTRSIAIPGVLDNATIKLTLGFRLGGVIRSVYPIQALNAPEFTKRVLPFISYDHDILYIQPEPASACYKHEDSDVAMQLSCIFREALEYKIDSDSNDIFIVTAALTETIQRRTLGSSVMTDIWELDTEEKRASFLDRYIELFLRAIIPPCRDNGASFDAHGQNMVARFDRSTGELKGFVYRDIDGIYLHRDTLRETCGVDFVAHSINVADTRESTYEYLYFMAFEMHLQNLIQVLGMHHNRRGWQMARKHFSNLVPEEHPMHSYFLKQEELPTICYIRSMSMKNKITRTKANLLYCEENA